MSSLTIAKVAPASSEVLREPASVRRGIDNVPLIPLRNSHYGPLVLKRRWRTFGIWAALFAASWLLLAQDLSSGWNAFALGMMVPGAGFLYAGGWAAVALALIAFVAVPATMISWFAAGNMSSVIGAWLASAGLAALYVSHGSAPQVAVAQWTPWAAMAVIAGWAVVDRLTFLRGRQRAVGHNQAITALSQPLLRDIPDAPDATEMNPLELAVTRSFYAKGLQPQEQWDGFALDVEQWQLKATRYQLYGSIATLAAVTYQHTPAFHGYARDAMANLIYKNLDKRIWKFWFWENLWGNYSVNPDPIVKDNIMVTGWVANYLGMYETLFNDRRFDQDGALTWRWSDTKQFRYSHSDLIKALMNNYARYDFSWYPCEPNLIYSMCNVQGFNALQSYDRLRGTGNWEQIRDRVERSFEEEFMHPDGRAVCLLFNRIGLQAPTLSSVLGEGSTLPGLLAMWPEKAERLWHVMKREFLRPQPDGSVDVRMVDLGWDKWDATAWAGQIPVVRRAHEVRARFALLQSAIHMGDDEVVDVLSRDIDTRFGEHTSAALKLGHRKAGLYRLLWDGLPKAWSRGPILERAEFPDVLVAKAVSDGRDLSLVLHPGAGAKSVNLGIAQLMPNARYKLAGSERVLVADQHGRACLTIDLAGRTDLRLVPVAA